MYSQEQYETAERIRFGKELQEKEKAPLADRKEGKAALIKALDDLPRFIKGISWLIDGSYGAGAYYAFRSLSKRMNKHAWLFNTIAVLEYGTSTKYACQVWNALPQSKKEEINAELCKLIAENKEN